MADLDKKIKSYNKAFGPYNPDAPEGHDLGTSCGWCVQEFVSSGHGNGSTGLDLPLTDKDRYIGIGITTFQNGQQNTAAYQFLAKVKGMLCRKAQVVFEHSYSASLGQPLADFFGGEVTVTGYPGPIFLHPGGYIYDKDGKAVGIKFNSRVR